MKTRTFSNDDDSTNWFEHTNPFTQQKRKKEKGKRVNTSACLYEIRNIIQKYEWEVN